MANAVKVALYPAFALLPALLALGVESLEQQFQQPSPNTTRACVALTVPHGEAAWLDRQLERAQNLGAGGVLLRVPLADARECWQVCANAMARARQLQLDAGISFFAPVTSNHLQVGCAQRLVWSVTRYDAAAIATNATVESGVAPFVPSGGQQRTLACLALPDASGTLQQQQVVDCSNGKMPTNGVWQIWRFNCELVEPLRLDPLNGRIFGREINRWLSEAQREMRTTYGATLLWLQIETPSASENLWTESLPQLFLKNSGLPLMRNLPAVAGQQLGGSTNAEYIRRQMNQTIHTLWREGCGLAAKELVQEAGLDAGLRVDQTPLDPAEVAFYARRPMLKATTNTMEYANLLGAGGARVFARRQIMGLLNPLETNDLVCATILHLPWKPDADRLLGVGATRIVLDFPEGLPSHDTLFRQLRDGCTYLHRCQTLLQQGMPVADMLVWSARPLPLLQGYSCDYVNNVTLKEATLRSGCIDFSSERSYNLLAVDVTLLTDPANMQLLRQITSRGVKTMLVTDSTIEEAPITTISDQPDMIYVYAANDVVRQIKPDFEWRCDIPDVRVRFVHRFFETHEVYFVMNESDDAGNVTCIFRDIGKGVPMHWNPESGVIGEITDYRRDFDKRVAVTLFMNPHDACFVVFAR